MTTGAKSFRIGLVLDPGEYPENATFGHTSRNRPPDRWADLRAQVETAEAAGFDSIWIPDHLLYRDESGLIEGTWECYSILSAFAAVTTKVELTIISCVPFRNPALLAKMADTIDEISGGRLILGLGAGWHEPEFRAFGYPYDHLFSRFREALQIIHGLLRKGELDFDGDYFTVRDCELRPRGPRPAGPPIMIGAQGPRMLQLTAQYADYWHPFALLLEQSDDSLAAFQAQQTRMDEMCRAVDRDPATLGRMAGRTVNPLNLPAYAQGPGGTALSGSPEEIAAEILRWRALGASHLFLNIGPRSVEGIEAMASVLDIVQAA